VFVKDERNQFLQINAWFQFVSIIIIIIIIIIISSSSSSSSKKVKGKGRTFVYRLFVRTSPKKRSGMDHTALSPCHHTRLLARKRSPDGGTMASAGSNHLIAAYYLFIDPERMKG